MEESLVNWSRLQFAVTAAYHWLFVPLTLGLAVVMALAETLYVAKGDEFWKKTAKFWMKLFGINFAVGIATGLILEFEFGTNWSNYSWFVGDIFGAPLAVEGIIAFFIEATFVAVMFFGWEKTSKKFHLASTWLTGIGATISAYWILVANGWMQHPVGTTFNPDTVRNEMTSFIAVATNPAAVSKFFHAVFSGWMTGGAFAIGISSWYLLHKREIRFAKASIGIASIVGLIGAAVVMFSGDKEGKIIAKYQPMKLAATEALFNGGKGVPFSVVPGLGVPKVLSFLATGEFDGYVPGVNDIINGYTDADGKQVLSVEDKMLRGTAAVLALKSYRETVNSDPEEAEEHKKVLNENVEYLGYGYLKNREDVIPNIPLVYWSFRLMIGIGCLLVLLMILTLVFRKTIENKKWLQVASIIAVPLVYIAGQAGWIVAEAGRQPWAIQDLLPVNVAVSSLSTGAVQTTFFIFLAVFALFLVIEIKVMIKAVKSGPAVDEQAM